ncbi:Protocatechuate 3,4-dioxygenase beta chain [Thalassoglobus polymorphus]|uniref:Protocatechuate 3,4-dioxygenase beta chain n=2 Tax=Thalassoglobus polymorphus TaxID=2527994 RepID=A0A517QLY9_9PLAN|nr:protocatechuate 3,4-dioxygenase [Thalassoglobus polymorphus]QDT32650.1 Protocatechuate 3,4-dioxygenase beta chain [Thalassoglobus polymorphus]
MSSELHRRRFLQLSSFAAAAFATPGLFAEELIRTPAVGEGPFYPDKLPLDTDNDLLLINDAITPAVGEITHLGGRILSETGQPIRNAFVEIWQVDNNGVYLHSGSNDRGNRDSNFQGYGRFLTDSTGQYYFRTIKPVRYPGRTPHIHFAVSQNGKRIFTTQMLIHGEEQNKSDGLFKQIRDPFQREAIQVAFKPLQDSKIGELTANFDIVLGKTPNEADLKKIDGGIGQPQYRGGENRPRRL